MSKTERRDDTARTEFARWSARKKIPTIILLKPENGDIVGFRDKENLDPRPVGDGGRDGNGDGNGKGQTNKRNRTAKKSCEIKRSIRL